MAITIKKNLPPDKVQCANCGRVMNKGGDKIKKHSFKAGVSCDFDGPVGRPTKYKPEFVKHVDGYLEECGVKEREFLRSSNPQSGAEGYQRVLDVELPSYEGFASYLEKQYDLFYISTKTFEVWANKHEDFLGALRKILREQKKMLVKYSSSGDFNSKISGLLLNANHDIVERKEISGPGGASLFADMFDDDDDDDDDNKDDAKDSKTVLSKALK